MSITAETPEIESPPAWVEAGHVPGLDGLRAVAIGLVLLSHGIPRGQHPARDRAMAGCGGIGVDIFFVISGFLITLLLLRERARSGRVDLGAFYRRRALRIFPAYWAYLACMGVLVAAGYERCRWAYFVAAFGYVMNFTPDLGGRLLLEHSWSLSVEEHFYLAWPWAFALTGRRGAVRLLVGAMAAAVAFRYMTRGMASLDLYDVYRWTPARMDALAVGCLLAYLFTSTAGPRWMAGASRRPGLVVLASLAAIVISKGVLCRLSWRYAVTLDGTACVLAIAAAVLACVSAPRSAVGDVLNSRPLAAIGVLSYSLYLWQQPFLTLSSPACACRWPQNLILATACALASRHLVEVPFLRLKDRIGRVRHG